MIDESDLASMVGGEILRCISMTIGLCRDGDRFGGVYQRRRGFDTIFGQLFHYAVWLSLMIDFVRPFLIDP